MPSASLPTWYALQDNPAVIGWQIDNETGAYGASNEDVFNGFVNHLKKNSAPPMRSTRPGS